MSDFFSLFSKRLGTGPAFEPGEDVPGEVARRKAQGLLALERGDYVVAMEWLEQALLGSGPEPERAEIATALTQAVRCVAEASPGPLAHPLYLRARRLLKLARSLAARHPHLQAWVLREAALLAAERGRRQHCRELLDASLEAARCLEQPLEEARTRLERGTLGVCWGWPDAQEERRAARQALLQLEGQEVSTRAAIQRPRQSDPFEGLFDWSCRLTSVLSSPLSILRAGLQHLLPANAVEIFAQADERAQSHPVLRQVEQRGHVVVGTARDSAVLGAPVLVHGAVQHLVLVERHVRLGPFDTRDVLLAQFFSGLAGAALENERNFAEQDRLQERLTESERHFREVFQGVDVGLALVDSHDVIIQVNQTLCASLGVAPDELAGRPFTSYLHPLDRAYEDRRFRELVAGRGRHYRVELRFLRSSMPAWAQLSAAPLPGSPYQFVRTLTDVSFERVQALMVLEEQERTWLATDLHDAPAQTAAALSFQLQALAAQQPLPGMVAAVREADNISGKLRELLGQLANPVLSGETLAESLSPWVDLELATEPAHAAVVYRVARECLSLVYDPGQMSVRREGERTQLVLGYRGSVRNLAFLRHRCLVLGGELKSEPGRLVVDLPF